MPFRHVVLFRWKPDATPEQVAAIGPALQAMSGTLAGLRSYTFGPGAGVADTTYDYAVIAEFDDRAGWDAYMADAEHDRIRAELIVPLVAERAAIQLEG